LKNRKLFIMEYFNLIIFNSWKIFQFGMNLKSVLLKSKTCIVNCQTSSMFTENETKNL
jgi:hypothetical protein